MIIKVRKPNQYEIIPTRTLQDPRLALDELGLLVRLISRPDGWEICPAALRKETGWGRDKLCRVLRNLQKNGYLRRVKGHRKDNSNKKNGTWQWYSELYAEAQDVDFYCQDQTREPPTENQGMVDHGRVFRTTVEPATAEPSHGQHGDIISTDHNQYRLKITTTTTQAPSLSQEIEEYLELVGTYGAKGDRRPDYPEGVRDVARRRILQEQGGRLSDRDKEQRSRWRGYRRRLQESCRANVGEDQPPLTTENRRREFLEAANKFGRHIASLPVDTAPSQD